MASVQCSRCKQGIHYHGMPDNIEFSFVSKEDWERVVSSAFDKDKVVYVDGNVPKMYRADSIELDFPGLIRKAWKCPTCGAVMLFDQHGGVSKTYVETELPADIPAAGSAEFLVFDDYLWDEITESMVPDMEIPERYAPSFNALMKDDGFLLFGNQGQVRFFERFAGDHEE